MIAKKSKQFVLASLVLILLGGCASEPIREIQFYLLDESPSDQVSAYREQLVEVEAINLPKYLQENQLLLLEDNHRLVRANYHHWADDPAPSIWRAVTKHLEQNSQSYSFVDNCQNCPRVAIDIEHFYPTSRGQVLLSGYYEILAEHANDKELGKIKRQRFSFSISIDQPGFARSVELMNDLLGELSQDILAQLEN